MANRAQRRAMMRGLIQNGITPEDVRKEYRRGEEEGFREAATSITKSCYAAIILALKDEFGFDDEQCYQALMAVDRRILYSIEHAELAEEVLEKTGLELRLDDPIERVVQKGGPA